MQWTASILKIHDRGNWLTPGAVRSCERKGYPRPPIRCLHGTCRRPLWRSARSRTVRRPRRPGAAKRPLTPPSASQRVGLDNRVGSRLVPRHVSGAGHRPGPARSAPRAPCFTSPLRRRGRACDMPSTRIRALECDMPCRRRLGSTHLIFRVSECDTPYRRRTWLMHIKQ
jgi:hypothetical protein